jgi:hypothetical protein
MNCGIYKHYKGGLYLLLGVAEHTTTEEQLAIYVSLTGADLPGPRIRARPLAEFIGYVDNPQYTAATRGIQIPRFEFVGDKQEEVVTDPLITKVDKALAAPFKQYSDYMR